MSRCAKAVLLSGRHWLRPLSTGLLLLAFAAFVLQPMAHADAYGHSARAVVAAATMAQTCVHSHAPGDKEGAPAEQCGPDEAGPGQLDCCQACLVATLPPEASPLHAWASGDRLSRIRPDRLGRIPAGILRPPRLITAA